MKKHHKSLLGALLFFAIAFILDKPLGEPEKVIYESIKVSPETVTFRLSAEDKVILATSELDQTADTANIELWQKQTRFSRRLAYSLDKEFRHYQFAISNDN